MFGVSSTRKLQGNQYLNTELTNFDQVYLILKGLR